MAKIRFSDHEILRDRATRDTLTPLQRNNLDALQVRLTALFLNYRKPLVVSSGYRPPEINAKVDGAAKSWHQEVAALDIQDTTGEVWTYCMDNLEACAALGLWLEDRRWTPTWVHLQIYPPASGNRVFIPNKKTPLDSRAWNGIYDKNLDSKSVDKKK
jgi:hypothetical protein